MAAVGPLQLSALVLLMATQAQVFASEESIDIDLQQLVSHPQAHRGNVVHTCGWARNAFESAMLTTRKSWRDEPYPPGVGVNWLDDAPTTYATGPEWRCVTGRFDALCGIAPEEEPAPTPSSVECVSTGHPYRWGITQQRSLRDE
jgi:hypothetical protein